MKITEFEAAINFIQSGTLWQAHADCLRIETPNTEEFIRALARRAPVMQAAPPPADGKERLFGVPIFPNAYVPKNCALMIGGCHCWLNVIEADGGTVLHFAKRHCIMVSWEDPPSAAKPDGVTAETYANEYQAPAEGSAPAPREAGGGFSFGYGGDKPKP